MNFKTTPYISYSGKQVQQAWLNNTMVWQFSGYPWTRENLAQGAWSDIAYGPTDTLIVVGNNRYSYSTNNGKIWATPIIPINSDAGTEIYNAISYGNESWSLLESLAYSPFGSRYCYTSVDILTGWTRHSLSASAMNPAITSVDFTDSLFSSYHNKFIAVGNRYGTGATSNVVGAYSTNGVVWLTAGYFDTNGTTPLPGTGDGFNGNLTEGTHMPDNRLVACGSSGGHKFGYSNNGGQTWIKGTYNPGVSSQDLQTGIGWSQVAYGYDGGTVLPLSGRYVAVASNGVTANYQFAYSNDGVGWVGLSAGPTSPLKKSWQCVTYGNGYFVALGINAAYQALSKDGVNWTVYENLPSLSGQPFDITPANNQFIAITYNESGVGNARSARFF